MSDKEGERETEIKRKTKNMRGGKKTNKTLGFWWGEREAEITPEKSTQESLKE